MLTRKSRRASRVERTEVGVSTSVPFALSSTTTGSRPHHRHPDHRGGVPAQNVRRIVHSQIDPRKPDHQRDQDRHDPDSHALPSLARIHRHDCREYSIKTAPMMPPSGRWKTIGSRRMPEERLGRGRWKNHFNVSSKASAPIAETERMTAARTQRFASRHATSNPRKIRNQVMISQAVSLSTPSTACVRRGAAKEWMALRTERSNHAREPRITSCARHANRIDPAAAVASPIAIFPWNVCIQFYCNRAAVARTVTKWGIPYANGSYCRIAVPTRRLCADAARHSHRPGQRSFGQRGPRGVD